MKKPHISLPNINLKGVKLPKKTALTVAGIVVIGGTLAYGAVRQHQVTIVTHEQQVAQARNEQKKLDNLQGQIDDLQGQNSRLTIQKNAACSYLNTIVVQKATRTLVTVPTAAGCPSIKKP